MPKFKLYAGLSGGFGGAHFQETVEVNSHEEALDVARDLAFEEYESYGGYHGLYTWDSMRQEIADQLYDGDLDAVDEEDVDMAYAEEVEGWIVYKAVQVSDDSSLDWDEDGDDDEYNEHNDDPDDCYFV